jgi:hypothetical protein
VENPNAVRRRIRFTPSGTCMQRCSSIVHRPSRVLQSECRTKQDGHLAYTQRISDEQLSSLGKGSAEGSRWPLKLHPERIWRIR